MANKTEKNKASISDYIASSPIGGFIGSAAGAGYSLTTKGGVRQPFYTNSLTEKGVKDFSSAVLSKNRLFKNTVKGGAAAAVLTPAAMLAYNKMGRKGKDEITLPNAGKVVAAGAAVGAASLAYNHRGKLHLMSVGRLDDFDPWKGKAGLEGMLKKETWVSNKTYERLADTEKVVNSKNTQEVLSASGGRAMAPKITPKGPETSGRSITDVYKDLEAKGGLQPIGGDPEVSLVLDMFGKKMPISVAGHPNGTSPIKNFKADFSVHGTEVGELTPSSPEGFVKNVRDTRESLEKFLKGTKVKINSLSAHPSADGTLNIDRRTAGGHIHFSYPTQPGLSGKASRAERVGNQDKLLAAFLPFDFTHAGAPARAGLSARSGKTYGSALIDNRGARPIGAWKPKEGFNNLEYRTGASYMKEPENLLKTKLELGQIVLNAPPEKTKRLRELGARLRGSTKNTTNQIYRDDIRKTYSNEVKTILREDLGINDKEYSKLVGLYEQGKTRKG